MFCRLSPGNLTPFGGTICFAAWMFDLRALPNNSYHAQFSCVFRQRHLRIADTYEVSFTSLGIAALWAVAKACLLRNHGNCACYSDSSTEHAFIHTLQSRVPHKRLVVWRGRAAESLCTNNHIFSAKVMDKKLCITCIMEAASTIIAGSLNSINFVKKNQLCNMM